MNIEKAEHEFVSLLDNKLLIVVGTYSVSKEKVFCFPSRFWGLAAKKALCGSSTIKEEILEKILEEKKREIIQLEQELTALGGPKYLGENPELEVLLTSNHHKASVFDKACVLEDADAVSGLILEDKPLDTRLGSDISFNIGGYKNVKEPEY
ncbi:hypothetical protein C2G38_2028369 [Gigaspora rosea]|uniref:Uncharacterized protein n=1 Tax=Gigaspora rosea TaxID=44941 RepID=A0A397W1N5_9GLOM|nr:hypothetical protein C2G38_2028369 [Gigaspora rosea]